MVNAIINHNIFTKEENNMSNKVAVLGVNDNAICFDYDQKISSHRNTAHGLWKLRERFISYLTDFDTLSDSEIIKERDLLIEELANIYKEENEKEIFYL